MANGVVYVGSYDNDLYAFDLAGGSSAVTRPNPASLKPNRHLKIRA